MKLDPADNAELAGLLGDFHSTLPAVSTIKAAYADPSIRWMLDPSNKDGLGRDLTRNAVRAFQHAQARIGVALGVPGPLVEAFEKTISIFGQTEAERDWYQFATTGARAAIDVGMDAIGAVPIVGWVCKLAFGIMDAIMARAAAKRPPPPLLSYDKPDDEQAAQRALQSVSGGDMTKLFLPVGTDGWALSTVDGGHLFQPQPDGRGGLGAVPGGFAGAIAFQTTILDGMNQSGPSLLEEYKAQCSRLGSSCILVQSTSDRWDYVPSLARVASGAWQAISTAKTAAIFAIDCDEIGSAWFDWQASMLEARPFAMALLATKPLEAAALELATSKIWGWKLAPYLKGTVPTHALAANEYARIHKLRQRAALKTRAVAYASESQAAFRNASLRAELEENRKRLLGHPARYDVNLADVPDVDFRAALAEAQKDPKPGLGFAASPSGKVLEPGIPRPLPMPLPDGAPGGGGLLAIAGLLGGGALLWALTRR